MAATGPPTGGGAAEEEGYTAEGTRGGPQAAGRGKSEDIRRYQRRPEEFRRDQKRSEEVRRDQKQLTLGK